MKQAEVILEVPFHDVDVMHVAWHGHYVKYFEIARSALLDAIDYNYPQMKTSGFAWPVIDMHIRYAQPLKFQQKFKVIASFVEWENRLKIAYTVVDLITGQRLSKGYTIQVAIDMKNEQMQFVSPDILFNKLGVER